MSAPDIVKALGPGTKLQSLSAFAPDYKRVSAAFTDLLVFPNLETISLDDQDAKSSSNLRTLVVNGQSRFSSLSTIDVNLARKVVGYDSTFTALLGVIDIATFVATMHPVVKSYADDARSQLTDNQKFFVQFATYIKALDARIDAMADKLENLDAQIESNSKVLADSDILTTLISIFKGIFDLADSVDEADIQVATLLDLDVSSLQGSFATLFKDRQRLQNVIASLKSLRDQISLLKTKFSALSQGLSSVTTSSAALLGVWDDVADRMQAVANDSSNATSSQISKLKTAWDAVAADANAYINALSASTSPELFSTLRAQYNTTTKIPQGSGEIKLFKAAAAAGVKPAFTASAKPAAFAAADNDDDKIVTTVLGPPTDAKQQLDELADNTGRIIDQFDTLLQQPYLDQLACTDPLDGSQTNIFNMVTHFKQQYVALQQKTLPVARDLGAYAAVQAVLLPTVVAGADAQVPPGDMSLEDFIATNAPLVSKYLAEANDLANESLKIKNDWDSAIAVVQKAINECTLNINNWQASVDQMSEQRKKDILYASLAGVGAFIAFTAAAFLPGIGMLAALAIGGALGALTVKEAMDANKLTQAINDLNGQIANAKATREKLENLLPYMNTIAQSLSQVSQIWSDIATDLTKLDAFYTVLGGPTGAILLDKLRPQIIANWQLVGTSVTNYIKAVSK